MHGGDLSSLPPGSHKLIYSDRTLPYLDDEQVRSLAAQAGNATRFDGRFCFSFYPPENDKGDKALTPRTVARMIELTAGDACSQFKVESTCYRAVPDDPSLEPVEESFGPDTTCAEIDDAIARTAATMPGKRFVEVFVTLKKR